MASCRPLYRLYDGQLQPQEAFLRVEKDGSVWAGYDTSDAIPSDVFQGVTRNFRIDSGLYGSEIEELIEQVKALVKVGDFEEIEWICSKARTHIFEHCGDKACSYCEDMEA